MRETMFGTSTELPMDAMSFERVALGLRSKLPWLANKPGNFLAACGFLLASIPTMRKIRKATVAASRYYVEDVSAEPSKQVYECLVRMRDSLKEAEALMGERAVLRLAQGFLARHRESLEDTIEAWDMAMDDSFRNMICSRLQEVTEATIRDEEEARMSL